MPLNVIEYFIATLNSILLQFKVHIYFRINVPKVLLLRNSLWFGQSCKRLCLSFSRIGLWSHRIRRLLLSWVIHLSATMLKMYLWLINLHSLTFFFVLLNFIEKFPLRSQYSKHNCLDRGPKWRGTCRVLKSAREFVKN